MRPAKIDSEVTLCGYFLFSKFENFISVKEDIYDISFLGFIPLENNSFLKKIWTSKEKEKMAKWQNFIEAVMAIAYTH